MELKNLNNLKDEIVYLEEAEELLQAIWVSFGVYELSDKVKKKRLKKWICIFLQISVFVGVFVWALFAPEEAFEKGLIAFALFALIAQVKEL